MVISACRVSDVVLASFCVPADWLSAGPGDES